jgi:hypothetical protein
MKLVEVEAVAEIMLVNGAGERKGVLAQSSATWMLEVQSMPKCASAACFCSQIDRSIGV